MKINLLTVLALTIVVIGTTQACDHCDENKQKKAMLLTQSTNITTTEAEM
jgi:hypothetical protein